MVAIQITSAHCLLHLLSDLRHEFDLDLETEWFHAHWAGQRIAVARGLAGNWSRYDFEELHASAFEGSAGQVTEMNIGSDDLLPIYEEHGFEIGGSSLVLYAVWHETSQPFLFGWTRPKENVGSGLTLSIRDIDSPGVTADDIATVWRGLPLIQWAFFDRFKRGRPRGRATGLDDETWLERARKIREMRKRYTWGQISATMNLDPKTLRAWVKRLQQHESSE